MTGRSVGAALLLGLFVTACVGEGSDVGPNIPRLPDERFVVLVRDDAGRGVCNAIVSVDGTGVDPQVTDRAGRADLFVDPTGRSIVRIDTSVAIARDRDSLAGLVFAAAPDGFQLPFVVHLPDLSASNSVQVTAGSQPAPIVLDDRGTVTGVLVEIPAGANVSFGGAPSAFLQSGVLGADRVPPIDVRGAASVLASRGAFVAPESLEVTPSASLSLPNDLGLAPGTPVRLLRLDPITGEWTDVGGGSADGTGDRIVSDSGAFRAGGLHCFVAEAPTPATVLGRVVDDDDRALPGVLVRIDQRVAITDSEGRFVLDAIAAPAAARDVTLRLTGGADLLPVTASVQAAVAPGQAQDVGDITFASGRAVDVRILLVSRGRADAFGDVGFGAVEDPSGGFGVTDRNGRLDVPRVELGTLSFARASPDLGSEFNVLEAEGILRSLSARRNLDVRLFEDRQSWVFGGGGSAQVRMIDESTSALIADAWIHRLRDGVETFLGRTPRDTVLRQGFGERDEVTLSFDSEFDGRRTVVAFSSRNIQSDRIEHPVPRADRAPFGEFEPFAWVAGTAPGAGDRAVFVSPPLRPDTWLDAALEGRPIETDAPVGRLPQTSGGDAFRVGVPIQGNVLAAFGPDLFGTPQISGVSFAVGLAPDRTVTTTLDLGGAIGFDADYTVDSAFAMRDPRLPLTAFAPDVGLIFADGRALELGRGLAGNLTVVGEAAVVRLPSLVGRLASSRLLVALIGEQFDGTRTVRQKSVVEFRDTQPVSRALLPVPEVFSPAPGVQVSAGGFEVQFSLPPDANYGYLRLWNDTADTHREWRALVPADATSFRFRTLPEGSAILVPGTWNIELTASRIRDDSRIRRFNRDPYQTIRHRFYGISRYERDLAVESDVRFSIEIVP